MIRSAARGLSLAVLFLGVASGCPKGDVGAPCNHGRVTPPSSKLITFPALSCDELLCVYGDDTEPPPGACEPGAGGDAECNEADPEARRFECIESGETGRCQLRVEYVLSRSMCSKRCSSNDDCKDGGVGKKVVVEDTQCNSGFECARIQSLGEFCCERLCVCKDDLGATNLDQDCQNQGGEAEACCSQDPVPDACGA